MFALGVITIVKEIGFRVGIVRTFILCSLVPVPCFLFPVPCSLC
ncbi:MULTISPECIES: hypothetical protein [unclassified Moorena]|nr:MULTISPECIES: hypothetical protein [unclassified Moorena]